MSKENEKILGLRQKAVVLRESTSKWAELYDKEEVEIRRVLGDLAIDVQHVGSTSIPDLKAKPILDIAVGVKSLDVADQCIEPLESIGYEYAPWAGIPDDAVFGKGEERTHLIHVSEYGGHVWSEHIRFRDALRANSALVQEYEALKEELAERHPNERAVYTEAKGRFIQRVLTES